MTQVDPNTAAIMSELKSLRNINNNNYHNFNGEEVDVDDAIANANGTGSTTAGSRRTSAAISRNATADRNHRNSATSRRSRISISENGTLVDYGIESPAPPPMPSRPKTPITHFGRNTSALTELDTLKLVSDNGSRQYWQMKPISAGGYPNGALSETTSSSGVHSGGDGSSSGTPIKKPGSVYGMYRNVDDGPGPMIDGIRNRKKHSNLKYKNDEEGHRKDDDDKMSGGAACCLTMLVLIAQIFLHGILGLVLYWVIKFHTTDGASFPFAWRDDLKKQFNLHPVLMVTGFIYFSGQAMLFYRSCRCCRRIWSKLFHTMFHLLAIPCIVIGFLAVLDSHNLRVDQDGKPAPIPNFYSLHSWMGATCMGLFALQFIAGFFSFLLLLCCESATASFRASLVPIHSAFGLTTFVLAVATACSGFTEKAFFTLSIAYTKWVPYLLDPRFNTSAAFAGINTLGPSYTRNMFEESLVINVMAACLIGLAMVMPVLVMNPNFRFRPQRIITVTHDRYE